MIAIRCVSKDGAETTWLIDEVHRAASGDIALWRSGKHIITLGPDDYVGGWDETVGEEAVN